MTTTPILTLGCAIELGDHITVHVDAPHIIVEVCEDGDMSAVHLLASDAMRLAAALADAVTEVQR